MNRFIAVIHLLNSMSEFIFVNWWKSLENLLKQFFIEINIEKFWDKKILTLVNLIFIFL